LRREGQKWWDGWKLGLWCEVLVREEEEDDDDAERDGRKRLGGKVDLAGAREFRGVGAWEKWVGWYELRTWEERRVGGGTK
jgi:hypothetical protein